MPHITFRKIEEDEALIYHDGELVGDLYRHDDPVTRKPVYLVLLAEDGRGWVRVHDRSRIRDTIQDRLRSHPLMG